MSKKSRRTRASAGLAPLGPFSDGQFNPALISPYTALNRAHLDVSRGSAPSPKIFTNKMNKTLRGELRVNRHTVLLKRIQSNKCQAVNETFKNDSDRLASLAAHFGKSPSQNFSHFPRRKTAHSTSFHLPPQKN